MSENINEGTVTELRRIRLALYLFMVILALGLLPAFLNGFSRGTAEAAASWERVRTAMSRQDFQSALSMANVLVERQPNYYYGHSYLGAIYMAVGNLTNAESHYLRAYQLFPDEQAEKDLAAVRKRMGTSQQIKLLSK